MMMKQIEKKRGVKKGTPLSRRVELSKLVKICEAIDSKCASDVAVPVNRVWLEERAASIGLAWLNGNLDDVKDSAKKTNKSTENESTENKIVFTVS